MCPGCRVPCRMRPVRPDHRQLKLLVAETALNYVGNIMYRPLPHVMAAGAVGGAVLYLLFFRRA